MNWHHLLEADPRACADNIKIDRKILSDLAISPVRLALKTIAAQAESRLRRNAQVLAHLVCHTLPASAGIIILG